MANKTFSDLVNNVNSAPWAGAFQYGSAIKPMRSQFETQTAYDQAYQGQQEARDLQNMYLRNQQVAFNNQHGQLSDLSGSGGSANPFSTGGSGAPTVNTSNRFEAGLSDAEQRLRALLDNPDSITQSAAYKFRVGQGQEALQRSLGAKGLLNSGNRLMELTKYGQDMGSQEYDAQAGRLGSLLGNYSQSWIGDKNANTGLFNAQAGAWNTAQGNADRTRLGYAEINAANQRAAMGLNGGRTSSSATPWDRPVYGYGQSALDAWDQVQKQDATDATLQKVRGY